MPPRLSTPAALQRAYERHARSLPRVAEVLLMVLLAHAAAILAWQLVPAPQGMEWQPPRVAPASPGSAGASKGPNVELIAGSHLFGEVQAVADPALSELAAAPDTRLDLTLLGILSATAERGSRALIGASNGEEKPFAIGDDVVRGVRLQAIFPDRVILARGGQLETLRLDKNAPSKALPGMASEQEIAPVTDTGKMLSTIRQELLTDPSKASEYIRIQPASSGGQLKGYRIYPGRDRGAFNAVGLRPGDLVTQVNGIQLNDANTALQMLGQLSQASSVSVVVERGGQQQTVNVNFN